MRSEWIALIWSITCTAPFDVITSFRHGPCTAEEDSSPSDPYRGLRPRLRSQQKPVLEVRRQPQEVRDDVAGEVDIARGPCSSEPHVRRYQHCDALLQRCGGCGAQVRGLQGGAG